MELDVKEIKKLFGGSLARNVDGMDAIYKDNVLYIGLFYNSPRQDEIKDFQKNTNLFYITLIESAMFISMKIGGLPVAETSYHVVRQKRVAEITEIKDTTTLSLCVMLVDALTGTIKASKQIESSEGFRNVLYREITKQIGNTDRFINYEYIMAMYNQSEMAMLMDKESYFVAGNS